MQLHFNEHIVNIIGKLISPHLYPNTLDVEENGILSTVEVDSFNYENYTYIDVLNDFLFRDKPIIPLG